MQTRALKVSETMVYRARQRIVDGGLEAALRDKPCSGPKTKLDDKQCAHLIAIACSDAPDGHDHWTLKVVELGFAAEFSHEGARAVLKKLPQIVVKGATVHPRGERRFRGGDGRRTGFVRGTL